MSEPPTAPAPGAEPEDPFRRPRRPLALGATVAFIALCAVAVIGFLGWNLGVDAVAVGLAAAIVPVPVLVLAFLWLGRYEPEPVRYVIISLAWGAFVATGLALLVNSGATRLFGTVGLPAVALVAVLIAPVVEEIGKAAVPLLLLRRRRHAITGITKGIVYCGLSATGFAMVENILYIGGYGYRAGLEQFGPATGLLGAFGIFVQRIMMFGFAHPLFTAAAGIGIGIAARTSRTAVRWLAPLAGIAAAMGLHATWNLLSVLAMETGQLLFLLYGYVAVMLPILLAMVGLAVWLRSREGQLTQRVLPDYVRAGWLSPPEVVSLRSLGTRHSARRWAQRVAGESGARAMRRLQFAATRLALLRDGVLRGLPSTPVEADRTAREERALLTEITAQRETFTGRDPQAPPARWDGRSYEILLPDGTTHTVAAPAEPVVPVPVVLPRR